MSTEILDLVAETRSLWNTGRKVMVQVAGNLIKIRESDVWSGHKTFPQYAENELGISQSQTSKLLTIADYFLKEYTPEQIGATDYECLYAAARLPGSVQENLAKAQTLKRSELRAEKQEVNPCPHSSIKPTCTDCWSVDPHNEANRTQEGL